jgi:hypothetical protein
MSDCPYGECPRGGGDFCDCWMPQQIRPCSPPEPCEACWYWSGQMKVCDRCCEGHTERQWKNVMLGPAWDGKPLIHKGSKT